MGANGDAGSATIGSPLHSWAALHADDPVLATWRDDLWLIFDSRPHIGSVDLQVQVKQVDPSEIGTVLTKVNADGLRNGPTVTFGAMCSPAQALCMFSPMAPAPVAIRTLDYLKTSRPTVGR